MGSSKTAKQPTKADHVFDGAVTHVQDGRGRPREYLKGRLLVDTNAFARLCLRDDEGGTRPVFCAKPHRACASTFVTYSFVPLNGKQ